MVITSTQTFSSYHEYTNLSKLYQSQSPSKIRVYFTRVKNYKIVSHNPKLYMLSITNW